MPRAKKAKPEPTTEVMADEAIASILKDHNAPTMAQSVKPEGVFVSASGITEAETAVQDLVTAHVSMDGAEHAAIIRMFDLLSVGVASPKEFSTRYSDVQAERGNADSSIAARKSNLKKVLEFSLESAEFRVKVLALPGCGLQKIYAIRAEMLKLANPKADKVSESVQPESDDDAPSMSPHDLVLHQINNAIDAAADAGYDDVAEALRTAFYMTRAKTAETVEA